MKPEVLAGMTHGDFLVYCDFLALVEYHTHEQFVMDVINGFVSDEEIDRLITCTLPFDHFFRRRSIAALTLGWLKWSTRGFTEFNEASRNLLLASIDTIRDVRWS